MTLGTLRGSRVVPILKALTYSHLQNPFTTYSETQVLGTGAQTFLGGHYSANRTL